MVVGAKVCELTDDFLWFVCGLYVGILISPLNTIIISPGGTVTAKISESCSLTQSPIGGMSLKSHGQGVKSLRFTMQTHCLFMAVNWITK